MEDRVEIELKNFFVFNPLLSSKEGEEHQKVLYYYPCDVDLNTQCNTVGLVEAIIKFTGNFRPSSPVSSLHTLKKRQLYFQPEENFWMVMTINLPYAIKTKDGVNTFEYQEEDVQDNIYKAALRQTYLMYRLLNGTYSKAIANGVDVLKEKMGDFYTDYLANLKLENCDILTVFSGIHYLPLDKQNFLNIQCFINALESTYPIIRHISFLFHNSLIWSDIEPEDMQIVYRYILETILQQDDTKVESGAAPKQAAPFSSVHYGRFVTGPGNAKTATSIGKVPKVYLGSVSDLAQYHLLVYTALSCAVCIFINVSDNEPTLELFKQLDEFMEPQLATVASGISDYNSSYNAPSALADSSPRFIYFNKFNLAYKSTAHPSSGTTAVCNKETMQIMADMNSDKSHLCHAGETIVKSMNDYWIVGKVSNQREFYVALQQKNASLIEISGKLFGEIRELRPNVDLVLDEVKKICDTELKGIFFHPI